MAMNPLPPQAYTKETLLRAYSWLQNQNNSIKEMATTPDILVSLFLKATRDGDSALDRPSIQNFKSELKSLAGLMGELEKEKRNAEQTLAQATANRSRPAMDEAPTMRLQSTQFIESPSPTPAPTPMMPPPPTPQETKPESIVDGLDLFSLQMLNEVQKGFNLSHQNEALRLLIKLGYLKAKKILTE